MQRGRQNERGGHRDHSRSRSGSARGGRHVHKVLCFKCRHIHEAPYGNVCSRPVCEICILHEGFRADHRTENCYCKGLENPTRERCAEVIAVKRAEDLAEKFKNKLLRANPHAHQNNELELARLRFETAREERLAEEARARAAGSAAAARCSFLSMAKDPNAGVSFTCTDCGRNPCDCS